MKLFKLFALTIMAAGALFMSSSCSTPDGGEEKVENILIIKGQTYPLLFTMYAEMEPGMYHIDLNTKEFGDHNQIHGYGNLEFPGGLVKVDVSKQDPIYTSGFNWNVGGGFYAAEEFKSGTQSVKRTSSTTMHIVIDCIDKDGDRFYLNAEAQDESTIDWSQFD